MFTHSLRWRLQLWLAFLLVSVLTGFTVAVFQLHRLTQFNQIDEQLERRVAALSRDVRGGPPPGERSGHPSPERDFAGPPFPGPRSDSTRNSPPEMFRGRREIRLSAPTLGLFNEAEQNTFYFAIWSRGGAPLKRSANAPVEVPLPERLAGDTRTHLRMRQTFREAFHFTELGDCILAGRSISADLKAVRGFTWWLLAAGGAVLALGLGGGWWLTTRAIRPVEQISAAASRISAGNLSERISGANTGSELGRLAGVLNSTFARLEAAFAQQKQFTADASHELRTPLAVIISEAQTALAHQRSGPEYRETVEACLDTAQQMRRLTESLLELARFDGGQERLQRDAFDLAELAGACVERLRPLAARNGIQITFLSAFTVPTERAPVAAATAAWAWLSAKPSSKPTAAALACPVNWALAPLSPCGCLTPLPVNPRFGRTSVALRPDKRTACHLVCRIQHVAPLTFPFDNLAS